jgi:plasmid stabilization system protein ParE
MEVTERRLVINDVAQDDYLELLKDSVRRWGRDQAAQYKGALDASMERLLEFPDLGQAMGHLFEGGHRLRVRHHSVYYTYDDHAVIIHRILHERRQVTGEMFLPESDEERRHP